VEVWRNVHARMRLFQLLEQVMWSAGTVSEATHRCISAVYEGHLEIDEKLCYIYRAETFN